MKKNLLDLSSRELNMFMKDHGVAAFRGTQIRKWLYQGVATSENKKIAEIFFRRHLQVSLRPGRRQLC